ncbi:hypothetical protein [Paenisporosarcina sp. TG-14]|uniref:hypothetical protein n=1 Tax=Paenisporosarcina sp. TG-14 TaxID=1231057 RepID=UPI000308837F|nr:hypothetical protein [Paenisporosarcina sp. TG-14]
MTVLKWCIIGTDPRMEKLSILLEQLNVHVLFLKTKAWSYQVERDLLSFQPDILVLPIQPLEIVTDSVGLEFFKTVKKCFIGKLSPEWTRFFEASELDVEAYLENEQFIWLNAKLTAEGFIAAYYLEEHEMVAGKQFMISGFGRVAKLLATQLKRMDAHPQIVVRSSVQLAEAQAMGYETRKLEHGITCDQSIFINTIPAKWLTQGYHSLLTTCQRFYDIASSPGCLALEGDYSHKYKLYTSLPGQFLKEDAAKLLFKCVTESAKNLEGGTVCYKVNELDLE